MDTLELNTLDHRVWNSILSIDLEPIVYKLTLQESEGGEAWDLSFTDSQVFEYRIFLFQAYLVSIRKYNPHGT